MLLNNLERAVLNAICESAGPDTDALTAQLKGVTVRSRNNTGCGFFTRLEPNRSCEPLAKGNVGDVWANISGFQDPMTFILFLQNGFIDTLEGAAIRDSTVDVDFSTVEFEILRDPYKASCSSNHST